VLDTKVDEATENEKQINVVIFAAELTKPIRAMPYKFAFFL